MARRNYGIIDAWVALSQTPRNSNDVIAQLSALDYLEQIHDRAGYERRRFYDAKGPSKRHTRLLKMFWAYKRMEAKA